MGIKLLKLFGSIKLAVIFIFILSTLSFVGVFFPRIPAHSIWFLAIIALLIINIGVCTFSRRKSISLGSEKAKVKSELDFYIQGDYHFEVESIDHIQFIDEIVAKIVKKHHYTLTRTVNKDSILIAGDKYRYSGFGTYAVHLSLLIFILGILLGSFFGFRNNAFIICEETLKDVGNNTGLSIYLKSFVDDYWENGTPKDYRSDVVLYDHGLEVQKSAIRVNHPMIYKGIRFHQSTFGPAVKIIITDSHGKLIFDDSVALTDIRTDYSLQRPEGIVKISNGEYFIKIVGNATNGTDSSIGEDEIGIELYDSTMSMIKWLKLEKNTPKELNNMEIIFVGKSQYSGFLVSKDPGNFLIWIASFLFIMSLGMIFYFPHREIWIALFTTQKNGTKLLIKLSSSKEFGLENELVKIISDYENAMNAKEMTN